ncbi:hypothetical protein TNCV_5131891 [Trichonephila clavipes]|nr:hypothetical protein TNCV_5131891 [Trichonephila clavipes]
MIRTSAKCISFTSSSTTQANLLPSASSIKPTTQIESRLPKPISATAPENSLNTSTSSSSTETCPVPQNVKQNSKSRRKRAKAQKPEIEIKMAKHKPRKSGLTEYTTDDENMFIYDMNEEVEPNPADGFAMTEYYRGDPDKYMRALTPARFGKSQS